MTSTTISTALRSEAQASVQGWWRSLSSTLCLILPSLRQPRPAGSASGECTGRLACCVLPRNTSFRSRRVRKKSVGARQPDRFFCLDISANSSASWVRRLVSAPSRNLPPLFAAAPVAPLPLAAASLASSSRNSARFCRSGSQKYRAWSGRRHHEQQRQHRS